MKLSYLSVFDLYHCDCCAKVKSIYTQLYKKITNTKKIKIENKLEPQPGKLLRPGINYKRP